MVDVPARSSAAHVLWWLVMRQRGRVAAGSVFGIRYPGHDRDALRGVDLDLRPGERITLVGPSGAGKSTLGRLLAGLDAPRAGMVTVGGVPVARLDRTERRRHVVLVTQEHHVFLGTVRDNLLLAAPAADDDALRAALATVGARLDELPDGLDTRLGPGGLQSEGAVAQQLALARVVLADPHTVVLDEATALLDPTTARRTERALAAALAGRTVVAVRRPLALLARPETAWVSRRVTHTPPTGGCARRSPPCAG